MAIFFSLELLTRLVRVCETTTKFDQARNEMLLPKKEKNTSKGKFLQTKGIPRKGSKDPVKNSLHVSNLELNRRPCKDGHKVHRITGRTLLLFILSRPKLS